MVEEIKANIVDLQTFEAALEAATKATFGDITFPGVGTQVWRELLLTAANYSARLELPSQPFIVTANGPQCVLCQQPLDRLAEERLKRFWAFIQNEMSSKRDKAKEALALEI